MINREQLTTDIEQGGPVPRIITVAECGGVVSMSVVLAQASDPAIYADHIIYGSPALKNPCTEAYVRRFMRLAELKQAALA